MKKIAEILSAVDPIGEHHKKVSSTFFGTLLGQSTVLVGLVITYLTAIALLHKDLLAFKSSADPIWFWSLILIPVLIIIICSVIPTAFIAYRQRNLFRLSPLKKKTTAGYYRVYPYDELEYAKYLRPDGALEQVNDWLVNVPDSLIYFSGVSGSGKSSLISAGIIPRLSELGWIVLQTRLIGNPLTVLDEAIRETSELFNEPPNEKLTIKELLVAAGNKRHSENKEPLLLIIDQFEEFLIFHSSGDQHDFIDLLNEIGDKPIIGIKLLLIFRSDYRELLFKFKLPRYYVGKNAFELPCFDRREAELFLKNGGPLLEPKGYDRLFDGIDRIENTRGLYRAITLNMVGIALTDMGTQLDKDPGRLIETYLRGIIGKGDARDFSKQILSKMITRDGTKNPQSIEKMSKSLGLEVWKIEATLSEFENKGLVRLLDKNHDVWEISHDFVARMIGQILGKLRLNFVRRSAPSILLLAAIGWLGIVLIAVPYWMKLSEIALFDELRDIGLIRISTDSGIGFRAYEYKFDNAAFAQSMPYLYKLSNVFSLNISDTKVSNIPSLKEIPLTELDVSNTDVDDLTSLKGMQLTELSFSGTKVADLAPLNGMPLTELNLSRTDVADLTPLKGMRLTDLSLSGTKVVDLTPLKGMPLTELSLSRTKVVDLAPLTGMPLANLSLSRTKVVDLAPLTGMPLANLSLSRTKVVDLAPLAGMPLTNLSLSRTKVVDLAPLTGMPLTNLSLSRTKVVDLAPLKGMPLTELSFEDTKVVDLMPLKGSLLTELSIRDVEVSDLAPLQGMPLTELYIRGVEVSDLAPLQGMPLTELYIRDVEVSDLAPLKGMLLGRLTLSNTKVVDLTPLQGMPLAELFISGADITDLTPLKGMRLVRLFLFNTKVSELAPLQGMPLTDLYISGTDVTDLTPLKGMRLKDLDISGTGVADLTPLNGMALVELNISQTNIVDLSPLIGMPLRYLFTGEMEVEIPDSLQDLVRGDNSFRRQ